MSNESSVYLTEDEIQSFETFLQDNGLTETLEVFRREKQTRQAGLPPGATPRKQPFDFDCLVFSIASTSDQSPGQWGCLLCEKTFATKGSAKRHAQSSHLKGDGEPIRYSNRTTARMDDYQNRVHQTAQNMKAESLTQTLPPNQQHSVDWGVAFPKADQARGDTSAQYNMDWVLPLPGIESDKKDDESGLEANNTAHYQQ